MLDVAPVLRSAELMIDLCYLLFFGRTANGTGLGLSSLGSAGCTGYYVPLAVSVEVRSLLSTNVTLFIADVGIRVNYCTLFVTLVASFIARICVRVRGGSCRSAKVT